jgi:hypothetical protein
MQNFAGMGALAAASYSDSRQLIAADLRSLIAQIEASMGLVEAAMTLENACEPPGSIDVFVLDDVTPRYATASAALWSCKGSLDLALQSLSEADQSA